MEGKGRLARLAAAQLGLFTKAQAAEVGVSRHQLDRAVRAGELRRPFTGVFADAAAPTSWRQEALAAVLAAGPAAALSHRSAVALHELDGATPARPVEVSVPTPECRRVVGVVVHRVVLPPEHVVSVGAIRATSVARTLCDASGFRTIERLAEMLDQAFAARRVTRAEVEQVLEVLESCRGRRLARIRTLLAERGPELEQAESRPEMRVYRAIVAAGLPVPQLQHWVVAGGERFRLDFAYPDRRVALEYLGLDAHSGPTALGRDARRHRLLALAGWDVLYFTAADSDGAIARDVGLRVLER
jgi:very-short-patch-repair endonuclease